ncbi:MAG: hypothetical protein D6681_03400 [Calditrichaeota bacterium]|nr:MAG: hypothetical protein D6681_03400 [Calditrichota bacterium]
MRRSCAVENDFPQRSTLKFNRCNDAERLHFPSAAPTASRAGRSGGGRKLEKNGGKKKRIGESAMLWLQKIRLSVI